MEIEAESGPRMPAPSRPRDQVVVLGNIPWAQYDALCRARAHSAGPRMAYLDGELEIISLARAHEFNKKLISRLLEAYAEENALSLNGFGSATFKRRDRSASVEPDECYCLGAAKKFPDLAIEVVHTSGGINKLEIYRRLNVGEVWFFARGRFWIYRLAARRYVERAGSELAPGVDLAEIARIVAATDESHQTEAVRAYRRSLARSAR